MSEHLSETTGIENDQLLLSGRDRKNMLSAKEENYLLKRAIWLYFILLIFEGALRKWVLPSLASPLLVIRDPIALWIIYSAWKKNLFIASNYLSAMVLIGIIGTYTAIFVGHGSIPVALFGARILLVHFPLIFIIGRVFTRQDVVEMGRATLWLSIPMVMLIGMQFYSPQSAWVNRGIGGDITGGGFSGSGEFLRPPATFSFTNGTGLFFGWLAPFVIYFWLGSDKVNKLILMGASAALLASIPFSISRTLLFEVVLSTGFAFIIVLRKPQYAGKMLLAICLISIALVFLSQTKFMQTALGAFTNRFDSANEQEGGLKGVVGDRFLGGLISAIEDSPKTPFFGYGLGMGTNVGAVLLTGGQSFLISEQEWGRLIGELGLLMGLGVIVIRVGFCIKVGLDSFRKMVIGDILPWMLLSFGFINVAQAQWAQPTSLGFSIMIGGLMLAALNGGEQEDNAQQFKEEF